MPESIALGLLNVLQLTILLLLERRGKAVKTELEEHRKECRPQLPPSSV